MRWMSPELLAPQRFGLKTYHPTKSSDCYALGMVVFETISGNVPFHEVPDMAVFLKVVDGERPCREAGFADSLWEMVEQCWRSDPYDRKSVESVLRCLEMHSKPSTLSSSGTDEGTEETLGPTGLHLFLATKKGKTILNTILFQATVPTSTLLHLYVTTVDQRTLQFRATIREVGLCAGRVNRTAWVSLIF